MIKSVMIFVLTLMVSTFFGQTLKPGDLDILTGDEWKGELTYLNYSDGKSVTMPVNLRVAKLKEGVYQFSYIYPNEPKANSTAKVKINKDGTKFAGKRVVKVERKPDGTVYLQADGKGSDNRDAAWFYFNYTLSATKFVSKKTVQYKGDDEKFVRNEYRFSR